MVERWRKLMGGGITRCSRIMNYRKWMIKVRRQKQVEDDEFPMVASGRWRP